MGSLSGWARGSIAGLAGGVAWGLGLLLVFGPAQAVLTDPALQSAKMLAAFGAGPTAPRMSDSPWILVIGLLGIGLLWGIVYVWIARSWTGSWGRRGLRFGVVRGGSQAS